MNLISTTHDLTELCHRLAAHAYITVDTEFLRETTFWPKLCVVQLASEDEAVAVDALADDIDLAPLFALMANPKVVKVFHAARRTSRSSGISPRWCRCRCSTRRWPPWCAASATRCPIPSSCQTLCRSGASRQVVPLHRLGAPPAFTSRPGRPTPWRTSPTCATSTAFLVDSSSKRRSRTGWLVGRDAHAPVATATYEQHPDQAWERFRNRSSGSRATFAVMMDLAAWRRKPRRRTRDVPRSRILKDDAMIEVATRGAEARSNALGDLRAVPKRHGASREVRRRTSIAADRARPRARPEVPAEASTGTGAATAGAATAPRWSS